MAFLEDPAVFLPRLFARAIARVQPETCLPPHLPALAPNKKLIVLGAGKAASAMALTVEKAYADHPSLSGLVITRYGHALPTARIRTVEAAHPVPDAAGLAATQELLALAREAGPEDFVLVLLSGGGSALMTAPIGDVSFEEKRALTRALLRSGAPIQDINKVRAQFSKVKGGRLAAAINAPALTLAISDVAGDDPAAIASGPMVPAKGTREDALAVLKSRGLLTPALQKALEAAPEAPRAGDPAFKNKRYEIVAAPKDALAAAAEEARAADLGVTLLGDALEGEARDLARAHAKLALAHKGPPQLFLSGGEVTVTMAKDAVPGNGGPNQEYALALALALKGAPGIFALAGDTDGNDGGSGEKDDPAGALITPETLARGAASGLSGEEALSRHASGDFLRAAEALLTPGPTFTNVNDFRAILVLPSP